MRNERTSKAVASKAGKALRGPDARAMDDAGLASLHRREARHGTYGGPETGAYRYGFDAGARWWHRQVKAALASALTQAPPRKKAKR